MTNTPVRIPVSIGELVDKMTILRIKSDRIADPAKLANVGEELRQLSETRGALGPLPAADEIEGDLEAINLRLWDVEDRLREMETRQEFGPEFIEAARSVYKLNDERARLKYEINRRCGSHIVEEKSYAR